MRANGRKLFLAILTSSVVALLLSSILVIYEGIIETQKSILLDGRMARKRYRGFEMQGLSEESVNSTLQPALEPSSTTWPLPGIAENNPCISCWPPNSQDEREGMVKLTLNWLFCK